MRPEDILDDALALLRRNDAEIDRLRAAITEAERQAYNRAAEIIKDTAQQWDDGEGSRSFAACMAAHDAIRDLVKEG